MGPEILGSLNDRDLQLILLPTEACNFRCVYCYEDFRYDRMEPQVVQGVKSFLARRLPDLDSLTLSWFGGEPLLAVDIVEDLLAHVRDRIGDAPRTRFFSDMTTNGYRLTRPVFERLLKLGVVRYQITLDGPRHWHDRKRVLAGGQGTFDRIWDNLRALRSASGQFEILVRLHVDRENQADLPSFIDEYRRVFGGDRRFRIFIRPVSRLGGPEDDALPVLEGDEEKRAVAALAACARDSEIEPQTMEGMSQICYAARANSFVVRADGRLNKCTVALESGENQIGRIAPDGRLHIETDRIRPWLRGLASENAGELACPMAGLAEGGSLRV